MYLLAKFFSEKQYAEDFMKGTLYCNSIDWFRDISKYFGKSVNEIPKDTQKDVLEGSIVFKNHDILKMIEQDNPKCDPRLILDEYGKCHVCCFAKIIRVEEGFIIPEMSEFGGYVGLIYDPQIFFGKIEKSLKNYPDLYYLAGSVRYKRPTLHGEPLDQGFPSIMFKSEDSFIDLKTVDPKEYSFRDCFTKMSKFSFQKEYRLCLYKKNWDGRPYKVEVGNLEDCCKIFEYSKIKNNDSEVLKVFNKSKPISAPDTMFWGNISRADLNKIILTENTKCSLVFDF